MNNPICPCTQGSNPSRYCPHNCHTGTVRSDSSEVKSGRAVKLITPHLMANLKVERYSSARHVVTTDCLHWPREGQQEAVSCDFWLFRIFACLLHLLTCLFLSSRACSGTPRHVNLVCQVATIMHTFVLTESTLHIDCGNRVYDVVCAQLLLWPPRMSENTLYNIDGTWLQRVGRQSQSC